MERGPERHTPPPPGQERQHRNPSRKRGAPRTEWNGPTSALQGNLAQSARAEGRGGEGQGTWASQKHSEAGYGRPVDRGVWTAKTVKRPRQQPAHPQYANYWAPLTRKRHTMPHLAQPQHTNHWAPRTRKRHQQEHRPQRPTESSDPMQHAKGRTGDCYGPRKGATTRRNVTQPDCHRPCHCHCLGCSADRDQVGGEHRPAQEQAGVHCVECASPRTPCPHRNDCSSPRKSVGVGVWEALSGSPRGSRGRGSRGLCAGAMSNVL